MKAKRKMKACNLCLTMYDIKELQRSVGDADWTNLYCSPQCYTKKNSPEIVPMDDLDKEALDPKWFNEYYDGFDENYA